MQNIDESVFGIVVAELDNRAIKARKARLTIGVTIVLVAALLSSFISYRLTLNIEIDGISAFNMMNLSFSQKSEYGGIIRALNLELSDAYPGNKNVNNIDSFAESFNDNEGKNTDLFKDRVIDQKQKDLFINNALRLIELYERMKAVENSSPVSVKDNTLNNTVSTLALSAGAIGFVLYILQIAVGFIRYYSRLAELYDSQKTALVASNGNVEIAKQLMSMLSNDHINLGKEPVSAYEKAMDLVSEMVKSNKSK